MAQRWFGVWKAAVPDGGQGPPQDPAKAIPQFLQFRPRGPRAGHQPVTGDPGA